jgi:outer membrane protein assembly factor BamD (BamD/ComL family)
MRPLSRRLSLGRLVRTGAAALALAALAPFGTPARAQDFSFEIVDAEVKDESQAVYDNCRQMLNQERYAEALVCYDELQLKEGMEEFLEDAEYDSAKALYRMGLFHAALSKYAAILERGPSHKYFNNSRDWLFFIARRVDDKFAAVDLIATYTKQEELPTEFKNEFNYQLARHFFDIAVDLGHQGVEVQAAPEETPADGADDASDDTLDFGADALEGFGDDDKKDDKGDAAPDDVPADDKKGKDDRKGKKDRQEKKEKKGKGDDGFDFSEDDFEFGEGDLGGGDVRPYPQEGFDFSFGDEEPKKKKKKRRGKKRGNKGKDKSGGKDEDGDTDDDGSVDDAASGADAASGDDGNSGGGVEPPAPKEHVNTNPADAESAMKRALSFVDAVDDQFVLYAKAVYLKGLIHYALGEFEPAVNAFREVVRMTHPDNGTVDNPKLRELAFFSLARIHYQFEQFRYAIFYYERIERDSEGWLDALFEMSWAHFRLGEYEKALGNLVTIQSPFFIDEYYPESHILKAITFYENCRYPEAVAFLDEFKSRYDGVSGALEKLLKEQQTPEALVGELERLEGDVEAGKDDEARSLAITARILRFVLKDKRLGKYRAAIAEVDDELKALEGVPAPYAGSDGHTVLIDLVKARRAKLVQDLGALLQVEIRDELKFLKDLQSKLIRIQFEIAKQQKIGLEATLRGESQAVELDDYEFTTATDDERVYWPFEGEYWRDELGTYEYTLTRGCRPPSDE